MKKIFAAVSLAAVLSFGAVAAVAAPEATIRFELDRTLCKLTIISTKDISNYTVNGVKTEGITTTTVTLFVKDGDVIVVKSGQTTSTFTVTGCGHDHDGDGDHDGNHPGDDHDHDGDHDADDHH